MGRRHGGVDRGLASHGTLESVRIMKFKPGYKVWVHIRGGDGAILQPGDYRGVVTAERCEVSRCWFNAPGYWIVDVEGHFLGNNFHAHENSLSPRDDPPAQQEPKREATGKWDSCVWKPEREEVEC